MAGLLRQHEGTTFFVGSWEVWGQTKLSCFAGLAWPIWNTRNKICIKQVILDKTIDTMYLGLSFIHKWRVLMKPLEKAKMEELAKSVMEYAKIFKPIPSSPCDAGVCEFLRRSGCPGSIVIKDDVVFVCYVGARCVESILNVKLLKRLWRF